MRFSLSLAATLALCLSICHAQLATPGKWIPRGPTKAASKIHVLPPLDNQQLLANEGDTSGAYQFGHVVDYVLPFENSGFWSVLPNGDRLWSATIVSEGALSLGVTFEGFRIPEGGELYLLSIGKNKTRGAFTSLNNPPREGDGLLTTFPIEGSSLTLEYYQPAIVKALPTLDIVKVTHGYKPLSFGSSGSCNINVACDPGLAWANEIRSVGMLLNRFGSRFCSGALVNNADYDGDQLFLTAYHCGVGSTDQVMFNYQSKTCTPNQDGPTNQIVGGLLPLARNSNSDFALLRITEPIPDSWNVFLSGISGENVAPQSMVGIHHPSGDIKKICYAEKPGVPTRWSSSEPGNWHWRVASWDKGTTEPGSSGSPLFDPKRRVVGQLHGGAASCRVIDFDSYGATWASWSLGLGEHIDPSGTGTLLIDGVDLNSVRKN
jgi:lysyl endopeptidase